MSKRQRVIVIGSAVLALVALAALSVAAFAQGPAEDAAGDPLSALNLDLLADEQAGTASPDLALQEPPGNRAARPFIQQRMRENLAQALAVTPEELDDARWTAFLATLEDAVEEGYLAQQAADRVLAQALIRQTASRDELIAAALGITVAKWQAAREEGQTVSQLVDELGLDATTIGQNLANFLEALIQGAAEDGLIGDEQAQRFLDDELLDRLARGLWRPWLRPHRPASRG